VIYNLIFIPLQFAFDIKFKHFYLAMEILTILIYLVEVAIRIYKLTRLTELKNKPMSEVVNLKDQFLKQDKYKLRQEIRQ